ncbi:multiple sugar transport system substrate-binding protein [Clostridium saccharoperbutylacetonicum]|uniref:ABC-type sugar transport system, periplasmic component n=2 Tax=Clostridium TaxID=1485 RepID=M1MN75_9CLOT|nr:extracellular solute-binding protein [Clostridium saccharoperbutylacetonicum]AGF59324.1 ABC-type sugar transport system, periplasmic component [Clostridium saccharoperbutylacetonicum N1-4(HMT)]NRT59888.1 multiple sugar transport system substrate-binding protein [Clostridium saccharoperbutylacetonicum]NSB23200.1 multiple sugar transport system substrate-binding protein [Clostridium saccharoperbutylacetonicum]NSB42570.1 multiple sugar transport system substrate-binding protein [Clostridium sac
MRRILSYIFLGVFIVAIIFSSVGCNGLNKTNSKVDDDSKEVNLKFIWWGNDQRKNITQQAIELFQKKHPNVKFEVKSYASTSDVKVNLAMNTADEDMPDIIQANYDFVHNYANRNLFEPFEPYVEKNIVNLSDVDKSSLEAGTDNGQLYGLPWGINAYCMAVNPSVFEKAGVDMLKSGYTYDELYETLKKLKSQINDPNFYPLANFVDYNNFVRAYGSTYFNSEGTALGYKDDQIFIDYFNFYKKCLDEGLIAPVTITDKNALISSGKSALWWGVSNQVSGLNKTSNTSMQIISVPSKTKGKITSCIRPSMYLCVSSYSKHKKEAMEFIDFLTNDLEVNDILKAERGVSTSAKVSDNLEKKASEGDKQQYLFLKYIKENPSPQDPPTPNTAGNVNALLQRLTDEILAGTLMPEDAAKQFRTSANKILSGVKGGE